MIMSMRSMMNSVRITGLLAVLTGAFLGVGYILGGQGGMILGFVLALVMNFGSYWFSDKIALKIHRAKPLQKESAPELHESVEKLAQNAGIPKPELYMTPMKIPNAFATGRSPKKGVIAVTEGLMNQLDRDEIDGVIAHEMAHIKNRDTLVNSVVATIAGAMSMAAELAFYGAMFGGDEDMSDLAGGMVMMILTPLVATVIRMAISRRMEFRADSDAVKIHGQKEGLKSALETISSTNSRTRVRGTRAQEVGANMYISNPFNKHKLVKYFSTHPPLEKRLKNIDQSVTN